uniref:Uncharacterized protein ravX6 n=1 Tax=Streptomyces ravidus TaxID=691266 RepID=D1H0I9_9ACTN|nr:hypothetical protein [Streptomyces ravidus]
MPLVNQHSTPAAIPGAVIRKPGQSRRRVPRLYRRCITHDQACCSVPGMKFGRYTA